MAAKQSSILKLKAAGWSDLDIQHREELHGQIAARDSEFKMQTWITQAEWDRKVSLRLPTADFAIYEVTMAKLRRK